MGQQGQGQQGQGQQGQNKAWATAGKVAVWALAVVLVSQAVSASCYTKACRRMDAEKALEALAKAEASALSWNATPYAWKSYDDKLRTEGSHRRYLAAFHARFDWQMPEGFTLEHPENLKTRQRAWAARWRERLPDDAEAWCRGAALEEDVEVALELLGEAREHLPHASVIATCYADTLTRAGRFAGALDAMRDFRDRHLQDADAHRAFIRYLRTAQRPPRGNISFVRKRFGDEAAERLLLQQAHAPSQEDVAAAYEDFAAFVETLDAQLALLRYRLEHGPEAEAKVVLQRLERRHWKPGEHHSLCQGLRQAGADADRTLACWRGLAAVGADGESFTDLLRALARAEVIRELSKAGDEPAIDAFLAPFSTRERLLAAMHVRLGEAASCARFRTILVAARAPGERALDVHEWKRIETRLRGCRAPEDDSLRAQALEALGRSPAARRAALEAAIESLPDHSPESAANHEALDRLNTTVPLGERKKHLRRWSTIAPDHAKPIERLVELAIEQDDPAAAAAWMDEAMLRGREGVDQVLRIGAIALVANRHSDAARAARLVAAGGDTSPRQQAEAAYLLARVDRANGRLDAASDGFEHYFERRLAYEGCCGIPDCDRGFLLHLIESHDRSRLDRYLERRAEALRHYREQIPSYAPRLAHHPPPTCQSDVVPPEVRAWIGQGCVLATTVPFLDRAALANPDNRSIQRRLTEARERPVCADRSGAEVEPDAPIDTSFDGEALLALVADMRRVR